MADKFIYIKDSDGNKYYLDAVSDVTYTQSGTPTEYHVESGKKVSDHYEQNQDVVTYSGDISEVKFINNGEVTTSLEDFVVKITALKKSGKPFTCGFAKILPSLKNCVFTNLDFSQNKQTGRFAYNVNISIKQILTANRADIVATPVPASAYADRLEDKSDSQGNTYDVPERDKNYLQKKTNELLGTDYFEGV